MEGKGGKYPAYGGLHMGGNCGKKVGPTWGEKCSQSLLLFLFCIFLHSISKVESNMSILGIVILEFKPLSLFSKSVG